MIWLAVSGGWHSPSFVTKALPFCHKRFAASTGMTCRTGTILCKTTSSFSGKGMVPKSQKRRTFPTMSLWKTEPFTLNCGQTFVTIVAKPFDESHSHGLSSFRWGCFWSSPISSSRCRGCCRLSRFFSCSDNKISLHLIS